MEGDFEQAQREQLAHPGVNSGDLLLAPQPGDEELVGCGAKNLGFPAPPTRPPQPLVGKQERIDDFLGRLRDLLNETDSEQLRGLLADEKGGMSASLAEKLEQASALARTSTTTAQTPPSAEYLERLREKIEAQVLKSIEQLGETESRELSSLELNGAKELDAIGSGLEPPAERLISLTPDALQPHAAPKILPPPQRSVVDTNKHSMKALLTRKAAKQVKGMEAMTSEEVLQDQARHEGFQVRSTAEPQPAVDRVQREEAQPWTLAPDDSKPTSDIPESEEEDEQEEEKNGSQLKNHTEPVASATPASLFPALDFGLLANGTLQAEAAARRQAERLRTDKAAEELSAGLDTRSLAERIAATEEQRRQLETKNRADPPDATTSTAPASPPSLQNPEQVSRQLERMFFDWTKGAFGPLNG